MSTTGATAEAEVGGVAAGGAGGWVRVAVLMGAAAVGACVGAAVVIVRVLACTGFAADACRACAAVRTGFAAVVSLAAAELLVSAGCGASVLVSAGAEAAGIASVVGAG
jgi:hypothetical protein